MPPYTPRKHPRSAFEAPIKYSIPNSNEYRCSRTLNGSAAGLCFETDQKLAPEDEVCVVMDNYAPEQPGPESFRSYLARVRWVKPCTTPRQECFVTGTQIMACSHEVLIPRGEERCQICDMCGALIKACRLQCTKGCAQLCEACNQHYEAVCEGQSSACLDRFLIGNVV